MTNATETMTVLLTLATSAAIQQADLVAHNIENRRNAGQNPAEWADCVLETVAGFGLLDSLNFEMSEAHGRKANSEEVAVFMSLYATAARAAAKARGVESSDHYTDEMASWAN